MTDKQRVQVGDLSGPSQIRPQSTLPDTYSRPRKDAQAGSLLGQLSDALGSLNPGVLAISRVLAQDINEEEFVSGQQFRQHIKDANKVDKSGWSRARLQGYEMVDAQITASKLPFAYEEALRQNGLWDKTNASPEEVEKVFSGIREKYSSLGQGSSPVWSKTFEQYRQGFENGVMQRWLSNNAQLREQENYDKLVSHSSEQIAGFLQQQNVDEANKSLHSYLDSSFMDIAVDGPKFNRGIAAGFQNAYSVALSKGDYTSADRIREMMAKFETKEGSKLSDTQYGQVALGNMDQARHYAAQNLREAQQAMREQTRAQLNAAQWDFVKNYVGKPAYMWPADLPKEFYNAAGPAGFADDFRRNYQEWKNSYKQTKESDPEVVQRLTELNVAATMADSEESLKDIHAQMMEIGPQASGEKGMELFSRLSKTYDEKMTIRGPNGFSKNPAYSEGKQNFDRVMRQSFGELKAELRKVYESEQKAGHWMNIPGVSVDATDDGKVDFFFPDIEMGMKDGLPQERWTLGRG